MCCTGRVWCILAFLAAACSCGCHGGEHIRFNLRWENLPPTAEHPCTFVLAETRCVAVGADVQSSARLEGARAWVISADVLEGDVPVLSPQFPPFIFLPPLVMGLDREYRLTLFSPGYAAVTLYPEGMGNEKLDYRKMPTSPWDTPMFLEVNDSKSHTGKDAKVEVPFSPGLDGPAYEIRFRRLPLDRVRPADAYTFREQLKSLNEAIAAGSLLWIKLDERRVLGEAIRPEKELMVAAIRQARIHVPVDLASDLTTLYDRVQAWCAPGR